MNNDLREEGRHAMASFSDSLNKDMWRKLLESEAPVCCGQKMFVSGRNYHCDYCGKIERTRHATCPC
jgi:hypothetical protein